MLSLSGLAPMAGFGSRHGPAERIVKTVEHHVPLDIEEGAYGDMVIEKDTARSDRTFSYEPNGGKGKYLPKVFIRGPSTITCLRQKADGRDKLWMSDTPQEYATNKQGITRVRGHVLVGGLGLGLVLKLMSESKKRITEVTVVDQSKNLIQLMGPQVTDSRFRFPVNVVHGDVRDVSTWKTWNPATREFEAGDYPLYDTAYLDIWPTLIGGLPKVWPDIVPVFDLVKGSIGLWAEISLRKRMREHFPLRRGYWGECRSTDFYDPIIDFAEEKNIGVHTHKWEGRMRTQYDENAICAAWWDATFKKRG